MKTTTSPYNAALTGGGFLFDETNILLPLLMSDDRNKLLKAEALDNNLLHINAETSRKRIISEISRRFDSVSKAFWSDYLAMSDEEKQVALLFVILKTYKIAFDFHINVVIRKWNSISRAVTLEDLMMEFSEIASRDEFVDSWTELTKRKVASAYLTILRKVNLLNQDGELNPIKSANFKYYILKGESWFLEACLLQPYEIENIKRSIR